MNYLRSTETRYMLKAYSKNKSNPKDKRTRAFKLMQKIDSARAKAEFLTDHYIANHLVKGY